MSEELDEQFLSALVRRDPSRVAAILERKANPCLLLDNGETPLHFIVRQSNDVDSALTIVELLLNAKADPFARCTLQMTPLHHVKALEIAVKLIDAKADVNSVDEYGWSPLMKAVTMRFA